jgi:hypothetical protein
MRLQVQPPAATQRIERNPLKPLATHNSQANPQPNKWRHIIEVYRKLRYSSMYEYGRRRSSGEDVVGPVSVDAGQLRRHL